MDVRSVVFRETAREGGRKNRGRHRPARQPDEIGGVAPRHARRTRIIDSFLLPATDKRSQPNRRARGADRQTREEGEGVKERSLLIPTAKKSFPLSLHAAGRKRRQFKLRGEEWGRGKKSQRGEVGRKKDRRKEMTEDLSNFDRERGGGAIGGGMEISFYITSSFLPFGCNGLPPPPPFPRLNRGRGFRDRALVAAASAPHPPEG